MTSEAKTQEDELFRDALFRQKRKNGTWRVVDAPALVGPLSDVHTHVHLLSDPALALARATVRGVAFLCDVADVWEDDPAVFDRMGEWLDEAGDLAGRLSCGGGTTSPTLRFAVGCHPHNAVHYDSALEAKLRAQLANPSVCVLGEVGLDYHYDLSPRDDQRRAFRSQVRIAKECGLPLVLHVREAHDEAWAIMKEEGFPVAGTLLHCCTVGWDVLEPWVQAGCYVSFGGAVTFGNADAVRDAACRVPLDRLLTETDAPYMAPKPLRGETCEPAMVAFTAAYLADLRGYTTEEERATFYGQLCGNAHALLDRAPTAWQRQAFEESSDGRERA